VLVRLTAKTWRDVVAEQAYLAGARGVRGVSIRRLSPRGWVFGVRTDDTIERVAQIARKPPTATGQVAVKIVGDVVEVVLTEAADGGGGAMTKLALALAALAACGPKPPPRTATGDDAIVVITSNRADAALYVDGRFVGPLSVLRRGIAVEPGKHRVELRRDEYFSSYAEIDVSRAEKRTLELRMAPMLP
jgi:hypothetical protein